MKFSESGYTAIGAALLAWAAAAHAGDVGVAWKLMDFDVAQPARRAYREQPVGANPIDDAVALAWRQAADQAAAPLARWLSTPNRLGSGMTARDVRIVFARPAAIALQPGGAAGSGRLVATIPGNRVDLVSSHPASHGGWMDPRLEVAFDLALAVDFEIVADSPHLRAYRAAVTVDKVAALPLNELAAIEFAADRPATARDHRAALASVVREAFGAVPLPLAAGLNDQLRARAAQLALPPGEVFNGGAVEGSRIVIAAFRRAAVKEADLAVAATWKKSQGELIDDCAALDVGARWVAGPPPYGGGEPPRQAARADRVYARSDRGESYVCLALVRVPAGAPVEITWGQPIRGAAGESAASPMQPGVEAVPVDFSNPVQTQGTRVHRLALARPGSVVAVDSTAAAAPAARRRGVPQRMN